MKRQLRAKDMTMTRTLRFAMALTALLPFTSPVAAQQSSENAARSPESSAVAATPTAEKDAEAAAAEASWKKGRPMTIEYLRAQDKRGINVFETTKESGAEFKGFRLDFGAAFTSQLQNLSHSNTAAPNIVTGVNANQLQSIGF
jgi:hypothetical protein